MPSVHIITASTSGNTEYVANTLADFFRTQPDCTVTMQKAELATSDDLLKGDILILGSGTWNTGGTEGQLNMHMEALLKTRCKDLDLKKKPITFLSLGDDRYYFTTRCTEHFLRFQREHNGTLFMHPLTIVNEPFDQNAKILAWGEKFLRSMQQSSES